MLMKLMEAAFIIWAVRKTLISQQNDAQKNNLPIEFTFICLFITFHFVHNKIWFSLNELLFYIVLLMEKHFKLNYCTILSV